MTQCPDVRLGEARTLYLCEFGLPANGGQDQTWWSCKVGPLTVPFYNFQWRKRAIGRHDLHHVITGFECTLLGEIQMAAWEFAAGPFPHWAARLFCLPLVLLGAIVIPKRTYAAFLMGRRSVSLYGIKETKTLLGMPLGKVRDRLVPNESGTSTATDRWAFARLVAEALAIVLMPVVIGASIFYL